MTQVFKEGDRLVLELGDPAAAQPSRIFDFQLLSPLLLGLLFPFIAASYVDPQTLHHLRMPIWLFLIGMFVVCSALFFYTHHFPGRIRTIVVDRQARTIEIVWRNMMATAAQTVPFQEISALRVRYDYDDNGIPVAAAELVLRGRPPIALPTTITDQELRPLRAAIGLG